MTLTLLKEGKEHSLDVNWYGLATSGNTFLFSAHVGAVRLPEIAALCDGTEKIIASGAFPIDTVLEGYSALQAISMTDGVVQVTLAKEEVV